MRCQNPLVSESPALCLVRGSVYSLTDCSSDKAAVQARLRLSAKSCFIELDWRGAGGDHGWVSESPPPESRGLETRSREVESGERYR